jgi:hypothetical protein
MDVRNDMSRISRSVATSRCFESIERHAHSPVADGLDVELEAFVIEESRQLIEAILAVVWVPEKTGSARGIASRLVRPQQRRGPQIDHAIHMDLDRIGGEAAPARNSTEMAQLGHACLVRRGFHRHANGYRCTDERRQPPVAIRRLIRLQTLDRRVCVVKSRNAQTRQLS